MLRFPYLKEPFVVSLRGVAPREDTAPWRPLVPVSLVDSHGRPRVFARCLLDTGSDHTVFPIRAAAGLGVNLDEISGASIRWRGRSHPVKCADIDLELHDGLTTVRWRACVAFCDASLKYPILGRSGCLEFFDVTFRGDELAVELEPNGSFPAAVEQP